VIQATNVSDFTLARANSKTDRDFNVKSYWRLREANAKHGLHRDAMQAVRWASFMYL
jgi:hypothetical protein